jgi:acyl phosphate:glycerol-3-phosphate acyltransferase
MPSQMSWDLSAPYLIAAFVLAYIIGSIPFGLILVKLSGGGDIRSIGSGNIGATNVLRTGNKGLAAGTLLFDLLKGTVAVLIGLRWGMDTGLMAGYGAILGHIFPVWLKFKGGKGVATVLGVVLGFNWLLCIIACLTWLVIAAVFRISSLAALISTTVLPAAAWFLTRDPQLAVFFARIAVLMWWTHRANIGRLLKGEEPKIGKSSKS